MRRLADFILIACMLMAMTLVGCKPSIPSDVLSEGEMEDILYDYHVAQAAAEMGENQDVDLRLYKVAVLKKHGCSEADFDSSMVYYSRHAGLLHGIYENLQDRLKNEAEQLGSSVSDMNKFGAATAKGDTADIWNADRAMVLSATSPFNLQSFSFKADTAFHKGDRMMLDFNAQFIFQDGMRDGIVVMALKFGNDSVAQTMVHVNNTQPYMLTLEDRDSLGIKEVKGYFMLGRGNSQNVSSTLKLMFVTNIRLYRMHVKNAAPSAGNGDGTTNVGSMGRITPGEPVESAPEKVQQEPADNGATPPVKHVVTQQPPLSKTLPDRPKAAPIIGTIKDGKMVPVKKTKD